MAEPARETGFAWPAPPAGLVVEPCAETPDAVLLSFPLAERLRPLAALTPAERGVLDGVRLGLSNAAIARQRGVSVRTVANQLASLFKKLGAHSRLDAALLVAGTGCAEKHCPGLRTTDRLARHTHVR